MTTTKDTIYGIKKGRSLRLGKEGTNGTQVLPSTYWRGTYVAKDMRIVEKPDEDISIFPSVLRGYVPVKGTEITLNAVPATFEQLPILLDSGVSKVTPVADGAGSGYVSAYSFQSALSSPNSIGARTCEFGDNQEVETAPYCFTRELTLAGSGKNALTMEGVLQGRSSEPVVYTANLVFVASGKHITDAASGLAIFTTGMTIRVTGTVSDDGIYTVATAGAGDMIVSESVPGETSVSCTIEQYFTAAATLPTVEEILFGYGKLYLGEVGTAIGSLAQVTNTWLGLTFKATQMGQQGVYTGDGHLDFAFLKPIAPAITLDLTMEWNGHATTERRAAKAYTPRKFRMKFEGTALTTAGTYSKKTLLIDGCGLWDTFAQLDEQDGDDIIKATMTVGYNSTAALFCTITVVNQLATVL